MLKKIKIKREQKANPPKTSEEKKGEQKKETKDL